MSAVLSPLYGQKETTQKLRHLVSKIQYIMRHFLLFLTLLVFPIASVAQTPSQQAALQLKDLIHQLISNHKDLGYNALWDAYAYTDVREDGKIWDIYSNISNFSLQSKGDNVSSMEGVNYNREHTVPQSWFHEHAPMKADLFQVFPVDGKINSLRNNHPYGEVQTVKSSSANNFSLYGTPTKECGAPVDVFEPADEYKGDLARVYFYMTVCYQEKLSGWEGEVFGPVASDKFPQFDGYPGMADWALKMFIRWSKQDPVSQKERDRNEAVYKLQGNRNPFVDCPGLERIIWADYVE